MRDEHRNHPRFRVKRQAFAGLISPKSDIIFQLGQIVDISNGGVSLYYIPSEKHGNGVTHISIFGRMDEFIRIEKISCKVVYDIKIPTKGWMNLPEIRCGIEFLSRSSREEKQIEGFIRTFAVDPDTEHIR